jgi:4-hydroxybenzoate polyprenyltransferase
MIRFSHTLFALPFALLATVMAWTAPAPSGQHAGFPWRRLLGVLICMVSARSAAMAFNRVVDREIDAANPRTRTRHLPAGLVSVRSAAAFTVMASVGFVLGTLFFLPNVLPLCLAAPALALLLTYSYSKRFTWLTHFWLGAALMLAPVGAWIALRGEAVMAAPGDLAPALVLGAGVLLWVAGFDIIYACQDAAFDVQAGLHSVPARIGVPRALQLAAACHAAMIAALAMLPLTHWLSGPRLDLGWIYAAGLAAVGALLVYEHRIVRPDDLTRVNVAFFHVNAVVSFGLLVVGSVDLLT